MSSCGLLEIFIETVKKNAGAQIYIYIYIYAWMAIRTVGSYRVALTLETYSIVRTCLCTRSPVGI